MYPKAYLYQKIKGAKNHIDKNFHLALDLDTISKESLLSKYYFLRLFKEAYGIAPHRYVVQKRIEAAKKLLINGLSVSQVCHEVGFQSVQSFSILFKKQTGQSPSMFKKKNGERNE